MMRLMVREPFLKLALFRGVEGRAGEGGVLLWDWERGKGREGNGEGKWGCICWNRGDVNERDRIAGILDLHDEGV
jgi:hypothetical protein